MNSYSLSLLIKPAWIFSSSYYFYNKDSVSIGKIEYPLIAKMFNSNSANLIFGGEEYLLVDAVMAPGAGEVSQRNVNTYIKKGDTKIVELMYKGLASNEEYQIIMPEKGINCLVKLEGFGNFNIYLNNKKIGFLKNKDFILRRSYLYLEKQLPELIQFLIFWGSINVQR